MADVNQPNLSRFAKVPFEVQIQLDRITMRVSEILELKVGSVVTLRKPAAGELRRKPLQIVGAHLIDGDQHD